VKIVADLVGLQGRAGDMQMTWLEHGSGSVKAVGSMRTDPHAFPGFTCGARFMGPALAGEGVRLKPRN